MIPRYSPKDMAALFSDEARFGAMLEVELLAAEALSTLGVVPVEDAKACRARAPKIDAAFVAKVDEREAITNHDTAARPRAALCHQDRWAGRRQGGPRHRRPRRGAR